jgi:uncharacterized protein (TIGR03437 family)
MNVPKAWDALGGAGQAGAGIRIGIIDSGIDQNHPGFQDASLTPPAIGDDGRNAPSQAAYTNNKVIVARSYVQKDLAPGYAYYPDNPDPASVTQPDDPSARDRMGHGTAIAMIAAGVQNTGPAGTIQGVAPKAFVGSYKVYGSPGINDFTNFLAVQDALADALADGMDVVTLSMTEGDSTTYYGPLDNLDECGGICDVYSMAVENAVAAGMVVVISAGNDGNVGFRPQTLNTIHRPGIAPSAITVGALMNSHALYQSLQVTGDGVPAGLQNIHAMFGDGPHTTVPITGTMVDVTTLGNDGLACSGLPAGSLAGAIALVKRGTCFFSDKINNAANAGASAVVIYQSDGVDDIYSSLFAQNTGVAAVMIGNTDGVALKGFLASNSGAKAKLDPAFAPVDSSANSVWPASSRGPSLGSFATTLTNVIKPEIAAIGVNIYTATQKFDPNGENYNASGYTSVTGTSFAVPMVAGAVALVKQKNPRLTPAQLKSAVVNSAADVNDGSGAAGVNSVGAGGLSAGDAVNVAATLDPATISFGEIIPAALPVRRTVTVTNVGTAAATFALAVQSRVSDSGTSLQLSNSSLALGAGQTGSFSVTLSGSAVNPGSFEGFITVTGGGSTLRLPYLYMVTDGIPADVFPIQHSSFVPPIGDTGWGVALRVVDRFGIPPHFPPGYPTQFSIIAGGGSFTTLSDCGGVCNDLHTYKLGNAGAVFDMGPNAGDNVVRAKVGSFTLDFDGFARALPNIADGGVANGASGQTSGGFAPGSRISIFGPALSDAWQTAPVGSLPVSLSQVSVSFDGAGMSLPGRLYSVSPGQVDVQIPWEFQGQSSVEIKVSLAVTPLYGKTLVIPLASYSPGIFESNGIAMAVDATGAPITTDHPAQPGKPIQLFVNGLGAVANQPASGEPATDDSSVTAAVPTVTIGGASVQVASAALVPGKVGLYQITLTVPADAAAGNQKVVVSIGGVDSKPSTIPVGTATASELESPQHWRSGPPLGRVRNQWFDPR